MKFEPQRFFIGLVDFFSILLPGALLTYLLRRPLVDLVARATSTSAPAAGATGGAAFPFDETQSWIASIFCAYLLGHFVFLAGSWLDCPYDYIRRATRRRQIKALSKGKRGSPAWARWLARRLIKSGSDDAVEQAVRLKAAQLGPSGGAAAINAFQWCKARLALQHPEALATVQRFEADSKFFRCLVVVLCVLIVFWLVTDPVLTHMLTCIGGALVLLVLALMRYADQRNKATDQAYWYIITLVGSGESAAETSKPTSSLETLRGPADPSHAGGVVYRNRNGRREYLFVTARSKAKE